MNELRFQRLSPDASLPSRAHPGDAGFDLSCIAGFTIPPGQRVLVGTGVAVEIPHGCAGLILPRSGLALKYGISLVNAPGLIDAGYRGELKVLLLNTDVTHPFTAEPGSRIAQLVIVECSLAAPQWAESLEPAHRGDGGFGSSGLAQSVDA